MTDHADLIQILRDHSALTNVTGGYPADRETMTGQAADTIEQQAARIAELKAVLGPLLTSAKMLQKNAEGCAVNHYGADFCTHGMPGWLLDTQQTIDDAAALKGGAE